MLNYHPGKYFPPLIEIFKGKNNSIIWPGKYFSMSGNYFSVWQRNEGEIIQ